MIYLVGGAPRTGKSSLARRLMQDVPMFAISTDSVHFVLTHAEPALGWDNDQPILQAAEEFERTLLGLVRSLDHSEDVALIEGQNILPRHAHQLANAGIELRCCFLGWSVLDEQLVILHSGRNTWFAELSANQRQGAVAEILSFSLYVKGECREYGFPYVDMSHDDYIAQHDKAYGCLVR